MTKPTLASFSSVFASVCFSVFFLFLVSPTSAVTLFSYQLDNTALGISTSASFNFSVGADVPAGGIVRITLPGFTGYPIQLETSSASSTNTGGFVLTASSVNFNGVANVTTTTGLFANNSYFVITLVDIWTLSTSVTAPSLALIYIPDNTTTTVVDSVTASAIQPVGTVAITTVNGPVLAVGGSTGSTSDIYSHVLGVRNTLSGQVLSSLHVNVSGTSVLASSVTIRIFNYIASNGSLTALPFATSVRVDAVPASSGTSYTLSFPGPKPRLFMGANTVISLYDTSNNILTAPLCVSQCLSSYFHTGFSNYLGNMTSSSYDPNPQNSSLVVSFTRSQVQSGATLATLTVNGGSILSPTFNSAVLQYVITPPPGVTSINVVATSAVAYYTLSAGLSQSFSGLTPGVNSSWTLSITSENGVTKTTYHAVIFMRRNNKNLLSISVDNGAMFVPAFDPANLTSHIIVPRIPSLSDQFITFSNPVTEPFATFVTPAAGLGPFKLIPGGNITVYFAVIADDTTLRNYSFNVYLPKSTISSLLKLNGTADVPYLSPAFDQTNFGPYTLTVPRHTQSVTFNPIATFDPLATVFVNDTAPGIPIALMDVPDVIQSIFITVTSEAGTTSVYQVNVIVLRSNVNSLATLVGDANTQLNVSFSPFIFNYQLSVIDGAIDSVSFTVSVTDPLSSYVFVSATNSSTVNLAGVRLLADQIVSVIVTSESLLTATYTVHVVRTVPDSNTRLTSLSFVLDPVPAVPDPRSMVLPPALNPSFSSTQLKYTVVAPIGTIGVSLSFSISSPRSSASQAPSNEVMLTYSYPTSILTTVLAESGATSVYNVTVFVIPPPDNSSSNTTIIIAAAAGGAGGLIFLAVVCFCTRKRYRKFKQRREIDALQSIELGDPEETETTDHKNKVVPPPSMVTVSSSQWADEPVTGPERGDRMTIS